MIPHGTVTPQSNPTTDPTVNDFFAQMSRQKEDMGISEPMPDDNEQPETDELEPTDEPRIQVNAAPARATAKLITTVIDTTLPAGLAMIAQAESNEFKATPDERDELTEALTEYVRLKGGDIPPGVMVLILVSTIYGSKLPYAVQLRKQKQKENELAERERIIEMREQLLKNAQNRSGEPTTAADGEPSTENEPENEAENE